MNRFLFFILFFSLNATAQNKILKGKVVDPEGATLAGVNIFLKGSYTGTTTAKDGSFELSALPDSGTIVFSMMGFENQSIKLQKTLFDQSIEIRLKEAFNKLKAVRITAGNIEVSDEKQAVVLKPLDIVTTSGALGDIVGALNTLPGTANNANDGRLFVRGGAANETAIFIDGLRLGNAFGSSLGGIPTRSRFSPQLFKGSFFSTGAYSAEYGQALSSVLSLNSLDFPLRRQTDLGLMSVGGSISHTEVWERQSITANLAYTNLEPYMGLIPQNIKFIDAPRSLNNEILFRQKVGKRGLLKAFYAYQTSQLHVLRKQIDFSEMQNTKLKNNFHHLNLSHRQNWGKKHLIDGGLSYSYNNDDIRLDSNNIEQKSQLFHAKIRHQYFANARLSLRSGIEVFNRDFSESLNESRRGINGQQFAAFAESDYHINSDIALKLGLRQAWFGNSSYLMPRASIAYRMNPKSQFSLAYGDYFQEQALGTLIQKQALRSSQAKHIVLNYQYVHEGISFRFETYSKKYQQLLRSNQGLNTNGEGYARGFDLFLRDRGSVKNLDYWITYSFIDTERHWSDFQTQVQPRFAPKHNASIVTKYWISKLKSQLGTSFNLNDGYTYDNPNIAGEMESKTKAFQSLNLSWSYLPQPNLIFHIEITNVLGRDNIFNYQYSSFANDQGKFREVAVPQAAKRFIFIGVFYTLSNDKNANQLNNL